MFSHTILAACPTFSITQRPMPKREKSIHRFCSMHGSIPIFNLTRQVGEANRHAAVACGLLAGVDPPVFPDVEPGIAN
jgi:hypothetical protein